MPTIFDEIRELAQRSQFRPALQRTVDLAKGNRDRLSNDVVNAALARSARLNYLDTAKAIGDINFNQYDDKIGELLRWLFNYVGYLEGALAQAPLPSMGQRTLPDDTASDLDAVDGILEAELRHSPIQGLAWLEGGLVASRSICKLVTVEKVGTGFLIGKGRILTNHHVVPDAAAASGAKAIFNYQDDIHGVPLPSVALDAAEFIAANRELDCSIFKLRASEDECKRWGRVKVATTAPNRGDGVCIIQHPGGAPKKVALSGSAISSRQEPFIKYVVSTMPGSSGSPVFNWNWEVAALHHAAGTWSEHHQRWVNNEGILLASIAKHPSIGPILNESQNSTW
jgi:V8-like Glu-specific endopeptidase